MALALRLGLRNLRRRPMRTALTAAMLAIGTALLVFSVGLNEGVYASLIDVATGTWTGQVQIQAPGYEESPSLFETVNEPGPLLAALEARPEVVAATARVEVAGLLGAGARTVGTLLQGVDPVAEPRVSTLPAALSAGAWLPTADPDARPIVIGVGLARRLGVGLGAELTFMGQAADGSVAAELFTVGGLIDSGSAEVDAQLALIRLADAQALLVLGQRVHRVVGRLTSADAATPFAATFQAPPGLRLLPWQALLPGLDQSIRSDRAGGQIFMAIMLVVVVLGVTNTLLMSVFERTRELGLMKALGTPPRQLVATTLWESAWLSVASTALGTALAVALILALRDTGIRMFDEPMEFGGASMQVAYPILAREVVIYPLIIAVVGTLAGLWPAWRAGRLDPVAAMREG